MFRKSYQRWLFLLIVGSVYAALVLWLELLQAPEIWGESRFWQASLVFSDRLLPQLSDLQNYGELNTPLPFMVFGAIEYLFNGGIFGGRLLNLLLSWIVLLLVGWPTVNNRRRAIRCLIGLMLCPYFLWYGVLLYTDMIACFFGLLGLVCYRRDRPWLSCIAFILAIASRQYMVAFPAAIALYEFVRAATATIRNRKLLQTVTLQWIAPLLATLSLLGWIYLFKGLAPASAITSYAPDVQKSTWALTPGNSVNFLAFVGVYLVIPEWLLFQPVAKLRAAVHHRRRIAIIAAVLLAYVIVFPPLLYGLGTVIKVADLLPADLLKIALYYSLALLACVRFSRPGLMPTLVLLNAAMMVKAYPWDKYVLPVAIAFWYLKSSDRT